MNEFWSFAGLVVVAVVGPYIMLRATAKRDRETRAEEKADRAAVAAQVEKVAEQAKLAANLLKQQDSKMNHVAQKTDSKLDQIHTLVDGAVTAAMRDQLDMARSNLVLLEAAAEGSKNMAAAQETIEAMKAKIESLNEALEQRQKQMDIANKQKLQGEG
jgi:hypothetical protein